MYLEMQPGHMVGYVFRDGNSKRVFLNYWDIVKHTVGA